MAKNKKETQAQPAQPRGPREPYPPEERAGTAFELACLAVQLAKLELARFQTLNQLLHLQLFRLGNPPTEFLAGIGDTAPAIRSLKADDYFRQAAALLQKAEAESAFTHKGSIPLSIFIPNKAERDYCQSKTNVPISGPEDDPGAASCGAASSRRRAIRAAPDLSKVKAPMSFPVSSLEFWRSILRRSPSAAELDKARESAKRGMLKDPMAHPSRVEQILTDEIGDLGAFWECAECIAPHLKLYNKTAKPRRSRQAGSKGQFAGRDRDLETQKFQKPPKRKSNRP